jgi:hypothetical protein
MVLFMDYFVVFSARRLTVFMKLWIRRVTHDVQDVLEL